MTMNVKTTETLRRTTIAGAEDVLYSSGAFRIMATAMERR